MKVNRAALFAAIKPLASVASNRPIIPITANAALIEKGGRLLLTAQNKASQVTIASAIAAEEGFKTTIPAQKLADILGATDADEVSIDFKPDSDIATIRAGKARFQVHTMDPDSFPFFSPVKEVLADLQLPAAEFLQGLRIAGTAASTKEARQFLNGVYFDVADQEITLVATNGHHLHYYRTTTDRAGEPVGKILPIEEVQHILSTFSEEGEILIRMTSRTLVFRQGGVLLVTKVVDDKYPDWRRVVTTEPTPWFTVNHDELVELAKMAQLASGKDGTVRLSTSASDSKLQIFTVTENQENFEGALDIQDVRHELAKSFSNRYLLDAITAVPTDQFCLGKYPVEDDSPLVLQQGGAFATIMPIRA